MIPVIDIFAGPGGLGEGFSALTDHEGQRVFKIALSIEKEDHAHQTLTLRSFFRQFPIGQVPTDYYDFLKGKIKLEELYRRHPMQSETSKEEAWKAELGKRNQSDDIIDQKIKTALNGAKDWLLIGGPPCQAYSIVGRSRRKQTTLDGRKDKRVRLYKQYLRILAIHNPAVFIMENVKGLLSAEASSSSIFDKILTDLRNPVEAYNTDYGQNGIELNCPGYQIYSLASDPLSIDEEDNFICPHKDFVIKAENYGIPQTRHRVILLGIRKDILTVPEILILTDEVPISRVLDGLPKLRSGLSKTKDTNEMWRTIVNQVTRVNILRGIDSRVRNRINNIIKRLAVPRDGRGGEYVKTHTVTCEYKPDWFLDKNIEGVCNHSTRGHMESDIFRYLFVSCFGKVHRRSPKLEDFPKVLLPEHENVGEGINDKKFADRFRVQLSYKAAKTITSHISKDGHYYIHPDPAQCRSFTVREAARIQTFPDNYFFCGPRTSQFIQVGNAVPPLLAYQISKIVIKVFEDSFQSTTIKAPKIKTEAIYE